MGKKYCIICGKPTLVLVPWAGGLLYECKNCGYRGPLFFEKLKKKSEK